MVSGWDRSPGPGNDYTPRPGGKVQTLVVLLVFFTIAGFIIFVR